MRDRLKSAAMVVALVGSISLASWQARAADLDAATQATLRSIITQQINAFGRDDADAAESFAAPGIRSKFPNAKDFNAMVHQSYAPLIHPRSTHFDEAGQTALGPLQKVTIVDADGGVWTAVYTFEQVDGMWRITGCALVKEQGTTI
ncbi:DUF4864 domain-containing protein [Lichenihabitans psoromatis]|uniref:DUF4864 domain-containing protein n=1 Tax=Lichenihabitans psoromatis TaxID=2528642 RepID=UPI001035D4F9|nr:DUF4864 domain-containing protein [Lichenihabitans psoromatis]